MAHFALLLALVFLIQLTVIFELSELIRLSMELLSLRELKSFVLVFELGLLVVLQMSSVKPLTVPFSPDGLLTRLTQMRTLHFRSLIEGSLLVLLLITVPPHWRVLQPESTDLIISLALPSVFLSVLLVLTGKTSTVLSALPSVSSLPISPLTSILRRAALVPSGLLGRDRSFCW